MSLTFSAPHHPMHWVTSWALALLASWVLTAAAPQGRQGSADGELRTVLVLGDSLSAAYGMMPDQGWVALTAARIAEKESGWKLVNASISGLGSAGGAERIALELKQHQPAAVVIALGANDGLRRLPAQELRANLAHMIEAAQETGAHVLLVGMVMPPDLGAEYAQAFNDSYALLAERFQVTMLPFLLEPIGNDRGTFQVDNLHPGAEVQPAIRDHVWQVLAPLLD